jgi:hypothetical protein
MRNEILRNGDRIIAEAKRVAVEVKEAFESIGERMRAERAEEEARKEAQGAVDVKFGTAFINGKLLTSERARVIALDLAAKSDVTGIVVMEDMGSGFEVATDMFGQNPEWRKSAPIEPKPQEYTGTWFDEDSGTIRQEPGFMQLPLETFGLRSATFSVDVREDQPGAMRALFDTLMKPSEAAAEALKEQLMEYSNGSVIVVPTASEVEVILDNNSDKGDYGIAVDMSAGEPRVVNGFNRLMALGQIQTQGRSVRMGIPKPKEYGVMEIEDISAILAEKRVTIGVRSRGGEFPPEIKSGLRFTFIHKDIAYGFEIEVVMPPAPNSYGDALFVAAFNPDIVPNRDMAVLQLTDMSGIEVPADAETIMEEGYFNRMRDKAMQIVKNRPDTGPTNERLREIMADTAAAMGLTIGEIAATMARVVNAGAMTKTGKMPPMSDILSPQKLNQVKTKLEARGISSMPDGAIVYDANGNPVGMYVDGAIVAYTGGTIVVNGVVRGATGPTSGAKVKDDAEPTYSNFKPKSRKISYDGDDE